MAWAVVHDRPDIVLRVLGYQSTYGDLAARYKLNIPLHRALMRGSFRAANALLDMGADVIYSSDSQRRSSCQRTVDWLSESGCSLLGSLALAAGARFHIGLWYNPNCTYSSERQFWTWKRRAMQKVINKLARHADQDREVPMCRADLTEYQRELDYALMEAAKSDAHSAEVMGFLLDADADVNREADSQIVGQAWSNVLDEEVPSLFRSKVEFLIQRGVDHSRVWSWEGLRTPVQFFLTKLHRSCQYTADSSSFVPRALYFMDFLATRGCLRWPKVIDVFMGCDGDGPPQITISDENEAGARELGLIFSDSDLSVRPLQQALCQHLLHQATPPAERPIIALPLPSAVVHLDDLYETWVRGQVERDDSQLASARARNSLQTRFLETTCPHI